MSTFVLIHGAGSDAWYWHLVAPLLSAAGHEVVAPTLPSDDDAAGLVDYRDTVLAAMGPAAMGIAAVGAGQDRRDLIVVGQSLGGFTAPLVCDRRPAALLVLVAAMVPAPGESPGDWWENTGWEAAHAAQAERDGRTLGAEFDVVEEFFHDVAPEVAAAALARGARAQSGTPFEKPWPLDRWPDVPTRFLLCRDDRFLPAVLQRRLARERLGLVPDEMDGGHLPALSRPADLAGRLMAYATGVGSV